jgi:hypothetical protein
LINPDRSWLENCSGAWIIEMSINAAFNTPAIIAFDKDDVYNVLGYRIGSVDENGFVIDEPIIIFSVDNITKSEITGNYISEDNEGDFKIKRLDIQVFFRIVNLITGVIK